MTIERAHSIALDFLAKTYPSLVGEVSIIYVPSQITTPADLTFFLRNNPLMTPQQVAEFLGLVR
jgi:hypothetical protein